MTALRFQTGGRHQTSPAFLRGICWTGSTCDQGSGQVLRTYTGRKTLPPSASLPVMGEVAGVNTASLGGYLHSTKTRAKWAEGFHDELNGHVFDLERDGFRQVVMYRSRTVMITDQRFEFKLLQNSCTLFLVTAVALTTAYQIECSRCALVFPE